jgi:cation transport ATPase
MPTQRLSMRRIREVLRLRHQGLTERVIAPIAAAAMALSSVSVVGNALRLR